MANEHIVWYLEKGDLLAKQQITVDNLVQLKSYSQYFHPKPTFSHWFPLTYKRFDTTWKYGILQNLHYIQDLHGMVLPGNLHVVLPPR